VSETAIQLARARLDDALKALVGAASDERARLAYERGYRAGAEHATARSREDRVAYRRGYSAGYSAGKRGRPEQPDDAETGRPRLTGVA